MKKGRQDRIAETLTIKLKNYYLKFHKMTPNIRVASIIYIIKSIMQRETIKKRLPTWKNMLTW